MEGEPKPFRRRTSKTNSLFQTTRDQRTKSGQGNVTGSVSKYNDTLASITS